MNISLPLASGEQILRVHLLLFFDVSLSVSFLVVLFSLDLAPTFLVQDRISLQMEAVTFLSHSSPLAISDVFVMTPLLFPGPRVDRLLE